MKKNLVFLVLTLVLASLAMPAQAAGPEVFGYVALFEVELEEADTFAAVLDDLGRQGTAGDHLISERFLRNIDPLRGQFAVYSKFDNRLAMERVWQDRMSVLQPYLKRTAEVHQVRLTDVYTPAVATQAPSGREFGTETVGQIAHLGLFVPFPEHRHEYERILRLVKEDTRERNPKGFLGEELMVELNPASVEAQSPYTPRALYLTPMSFNYGEFASLEDAENSYITRAEDRTDDPRLKYWYRAFFGSLQVPNRFFIFKVIGNYPNEVRRRQVPNSLRVSEATTEEPVVEVASLGEEG